jgi:hypothetical protein
MSTDCGTNEVGIESVMNIFVKHGKAQEAVLPHTHCSI